MDGTSFPAMVTTPEENCTILYVQSTVPGWMAIFDNVQMVVAVVGFLANSVTLITLIKNGDGFSDIICLLLKYQSAVDAVVCLFAFLLGILPAFWGLGNITVDTIICQLWHSTFMYWNSIAVSIWNLVLLAVERYVCICHPLKYTLITKSKVWLMIVGCFFLACFISSGALFNTRMCNGTCLSGLFGEGLAFERFMAFFAISTFFTFYAIPTVLFVILYGLIIKQFRQYARASLGASNTAAVIDNASKQLTKTAIVVTVIFIIAYSWDLWYYMLGYLGITEYMLDSPLVKVGLFLAVINSVVNPFIYASLIPVYRRSVLKTLMPWIMADTGLIW